MVKTIALSGVFSLLVLPVLAQTGNTFHIQKVKPVKRTVILSGPKAAWCEDEQYAAVRFKTDFPKMHYAQCYDPIRGQFGASTWFDLNHTAMAHYRALGDVLLSLEIDSLQAMVARFNAVKGKSDITYYIEVTEEDSYFRAELPYRGEAMQGRDKNFLHLIGTPFVRP